MKKITITAAILALLLAGCSTNDMLDGTQNSDNAIRFSPSINKVTKEFTNGKTTLTSLKTSGFGILASYTGENDFTDAYTMNFMWNQQVFWEPQSGEIENHWEYTPLKYWPNTSGEKISFFAYGPYEASPTGSPTSGIVLSGKAATGYPTITYTLNSTSSYQYDLVYDMVMNMIKPTTFTQKNVQFNFKHALSRVSMQAYVDSKVNGSENATEPELGRKTYVCITHVDLLGTAPYSAPSLHSSENVSGNSSSKFYISSTFGYNALGGRYYWKAPTTQTNAYPLGSATDNNNILKLANNSGTIATGYTTKGIIISHDGDVQGDNGRTKLFKEDRYLFLIPPGTSSSTDDIGIEANTDVKVAITYDIVTVDANLEVGYSKTTTTTVVNLPIGTLKMGVAYLYTFKIGIAGITVSAETVTDWNSETGSNL